MAGPFFYGRALAIDIGGKALLRIVGSYSSSWMVTYTNRTDD